MDPGARGKRRHRLLTAGALFLAVAARGHFQTWRVFNWPPMVGLGGRRYDLTSTGTPIGVAPGLRYIGNARWFPAHTDASELEAHRTRHLVIMEI